MNNSVPTNAAKGITSAGRNSMLPSRSDERSRSLIVVDCFVPRPRKWVPAMPTSTSTRTPLPMSPKTSPNQKLAASTPQKAALPQRLRLVPSRALPIAKAANIAPART